MEITAKLKHLRMAPRKVRVVANLIKGLNIDQARAQLRALPKRASGPVLKTLNLAVILGERIAAKAVKKAIKAKAVQTKQVPETALEKTAAEKIKSAPRAEKKEAIAKERAGGFAKRMFRRKSV